MVCWNVQDALKNISDKRQQTYNIYILYIYIYIRPWCMFITSTWKVQNQSFCPKTKTFAFWRTAESSTRYRREHDRTDAAHLFYFPKDTKTYLDSFFQRAFFSEVFATTSGTGTGPGHGLSLKGGFEGALGAPSHNSQGGLQGARLPQGRFWGSFSPSNVRGVWGGEAPTRNSGKFGRAKPPQMGVWGACQ